MKKVVTTYKEVLVNILFVSLFILLANLLVIHPFDVWGYLKTIAIFAAIYGGVMSVIIWLKNNYKKN